MGYTPQYDSDFALDGTVHLFFEQCAQKYADNIAIKYKGNSLTYTQLNNRVNHLAHFLQVQKIENQSLVIISMDRSPEMIIAILATIKAGCAYVPIDPSSPYERIDFIIKDTQSPVLLTQEHLKKQFGDFEQISVIAIDQLEIHNTSLKKKYLQPAISPSDLVYCIYTSGSTGKPKGVLVEHQNLVNLILGEQKFFQHRVINFLFAYSFAFDGSVLLIFKTLLEGATLVIADEGAEKDIHKIAQLVQEERISHLLTFPSLYSILLENVDIGLLKTLESVSVAGEACPGSLVNLHHNLIPPTKLHNQYGPTEATVGATIFKTSNSHSNSKTPIGKCIENVFIHLLDQDGNQVADGESGEICIGGKGVARGYLNRPNLNIEKFIKNPFGEGRLYKTGDLAKRLPDGNLDFIGRVDFQVKLRGYRIELGEIESVILQHEKIRESIVLLHGEKSEEQKLVAYIVNTKSNTTSINELRSFLEKQLPEYMIPAVFVFLKKMPLSTNGKVDRNALPALANDRPRLEEAYIAPSSELEIFIFKKWSTILNINKIGVNDKFFELGGNSLQAAKFIADIQKVLGENIFITSIFENPTIASFVAMLEQDYSDSISKTTTAQHNKDSSIPTIPSLKNEDFQDFKTLVPKHKKSNPTKDKNKPAIFILAPPRSGTTLLRVMLAGHPDIFAANELQLLHFDNLKERAEAYEGKFSLWKEGIIRALMELKTSLLILQNLSFRKQKKMRFLPKHFSIQYKNLSEIKY